MLSLFAKFKFFNRILPIISALLIFGFFEMIVFYREHFWWWVIGCGAVVLLSAILYARINKRKIHRMKYAILPMLLLIGGLLFFVLLQTEIFYHLFSAILALAYIVQFYNMLELHKDPLPERRKSILQFFDAITFFTAFLLYVGVWQLSMFFGLTSWATLLIIAILTGLLLYQLFWYHRHFKAKAWLYVIVGSLIISEITWGLLYWPTGFFVNGLLLLVFFYLFGALSLARFRDNLNKRYVMQYISVAIIALVLILASSQWAPPHYGF
ncbi:hypothetical protein ACFL1U_03395 [Patescibacteria group bacterium]